MEGCVYMNDKVWFGITLSHTDSPWIKHIQGQKRDLEADVSKSLD